MWQVLEHDNRPGVYYRLRVADFTLQVYQPAYQNRWSYAGVGNITGGFSTAQEAQEAAVEELHARATREIKVWAGVLDEIREMEV